MFVSQNNISSATAMYGNQKSLQKSLFSNKNSEKKCIAA